MSETTTSKGADPRTIGRELAARAATVAIRVADVLERHCNQGSGGAEIEFLRRWAETAAGASEADGPGCPFDRLVRTFELTEAEQDLLLLAGLPEEHEGLAATFRALHPRGEPRPTAGLAALVLGAGNDDRTLVRGLLLEGAAARHRLLEAVDGGGTLFERGLVIADGLWDALHGLDAWPAALPRVPVEPAPAGLDHWLGHPDVQYAVRALGSDEPVTVIVGGGDPAVGIGRCVAAAAAAGVSLVVARIGPGDPAAVALLAAHAAVRGAVPVIVADAVEPPGRAPVLAASQVPGPLLVCAEPGSIRAGGGRALLPLPAGSVGTADRRAAWLAALPLLAAHAPALTARHPIDPTLTAEVAVDAAARHRLGSPVQGVEDVARLIRARAGVTLPAGIELATPDVPWKRLVLSDEAGWQLRDAVSRLEHQSVVLDDWGMREQARAARGIRVLLTGPPGTGKSLSAEAIATAAGTDLLVVDTSQVVSKWIGETEKNLAAAFDVAERTQAVLLLDEADALFGSRTEISDAHDRYANLETAYLLQRLDRFDGLAVLATNLRHNIDAAFLRRMDFVVELPLPDEPARRELWTLHLPEGRCAADVDVAMLARRYPVAGGWIRNAAIAAAFVAAAGGDDVGQHHLLAALRREYDKAALPFPGESARRRDDLA